MPTPKIDSVNTNEPKALATAEGLVSISQAAQILDVSIDTVRRWDKNGTLKSTRPDGKNRYFSIEDLEKLKFSQPLSISEASEQLNISASTLRRLEAKGLIKPLRGENGDRVYDKKSLESFLQSEYFLRQKEVQEEILEPLNGKSDDEKAGEKRTNGHRDPTVHALLGEHHITLASLRKFRKYMLIGLAGLAGTFVATIVLLTLLFFLFPESTAKNLGYNKSDPVGKKFTFQPADSLLARQLKPFSQTALRVVEAVNPELRKRIAPIAAIKDVNDIFQPDADGNVKSIYTFTVPDTSYLHIPDTGLVVNLNSEFLQGRIPGCEKGNLAIVGVCGGGTSVVTTQGGGSGGGTTVVNATTTGGSSGDVTSVIAGVGLFGGGEEGTVVLRAELQAGSGLEATTSGLSLTRTCANGQVVKWNGFGWACASDDGGTPPDMFSTVNASLGTSPVADNPNDQLSLLGSGGLTVSGEAINDTITFGLDIVVSGSTATTSSISGLETSADGLRLIGGCSSNQILKWNGAVWVCSADTGGIDVKENNVMTLSAASAANYNGNDFVVTNAGGGQVDIAIDYPNSRITRSNQNETIAGAWTLQQTLTFSGVSTDIDTAAGQGLTLQGHASSSFTTTAGDININPSGSTGASVVIGGGPSNNVDLLVLDRKNDDTLDPVGTAGAMYYNLASQKFRCYQGAAWTDCIGAGGGGGGGSSVWSDLTGPVAPLTLAHGELPTTFNWSANNTLAANLDAFTLTYTNDGNSDPNLQRLLVLKNQDNGILDAGTVKTEGLLRIENNDDSTLDKAIEIIGSVSPNGFINTAIDVSSGPIQTALNVGANAIVGTTPDIDFTNFDLFGSLGIVRLGNLATYTGQDQVTLSSGGGGQLILDSNGGQVLFANGDTFNVGGVSLLAYNALSNAGGSANGGDVTDDNDLYIQGALEVDGNFNLAGNITMLGSSFTASSLTGFNCSDCIDFDDLEDTLDVDAATAINLAGNNLTYNLGGAGSLFIDLNTGGDLVIRDGGVAYATFSDSGVFTLDNLRLDGNTLDTTSGDLALDSFGGTVRVSDNLVVTGTSDLQGNVFDSGGNLVLDDTVDIGSATTGVRVQTTGFLSDIDGNLVLDDQTDVGSTTTGIRVTTAGSVSDIDGVLQLNDVVDVTGTISDSDSNLILDDTVDIGSATTGLRVDTAGNLLDIDGTLNITDNADVSGTLNLSGNTLTASGDLTINPTGGQVLFADTDVLNIGGVSALAYNALANAGGSANGGDVTDDNDLYIQGALEVDGNFNLGGNLTILGTTFTASSLTTLDCSDCINWDDISDALVLDAATTSTRTSTGNENSLTFSLVNDGGIAGTDQSFVIANAVSSNTTGDLTTEALLLLDQADTTTIGNTAVTDGLLITNSGGSTFTNAITIGGGSQAIATALNLASTGITTDIRLQNGEVIDNNTDNQVNIGFGATGGLLLLTNGSTLSTDQTSFSLLNTTATTINFGGAATTALNIGSTTTGLNAFAADTDWTLAGSENVTLSNSSASTDQLSLSVSGITTDNVDGLQIAFGTATGAGAVNSAIHVILNNSPVDASDKLNGLLVTGAANIVGATSQSLIKVEPATSGNTSGTLVGIDIGGITTPGSSIERGLQIGSGWDTNIYINDSTGTITIPNASSGTPSNLIIENLSGSNLLDIRDMNANFGGAASSGAFISRNSYFGEEFNIFKQSCTDSVIAATAQSRGDFGSAATLCALGGGGISTSSTPVSVGSSCAYSSSTSPNGFERISAVSGATAASANCQEMTTTNVAATLYNLFDADFLPVFTMKARLSAVGTNQRFFAGMGDSVTSTGNTGPLNGIYFSNCARPTNALQDCDGTLRGITANGSDATTTAVTCGAITAGSWMYLRIEVRATNDVRFFYDTNASNGIQETECGTGSSTNINTNPLALNIKVGSTTNSLTTNLDIDYFRAWQDDNVESEIGLSGEDAIMTSIATQQAVPASAPNKLTAYNLEDGSWVLADSAGNELFGVDMSGNGTFRGEVTAAGLNINGPDGEQVASIDSSGMATLGAVDTKEVRSDQVIATEVGAQYYGTEPIEPGDVVALDPATAGRVKKSDAPYSRHLLGVAARNPSLLMDASGEGTPVIVALAGRVTVNVNTENGAIEPGDALTSSSVPGVAMKATKAGPVIGTAVMGYNGDGVGTIVVAVNGGFSAGDITSELMGLDERLTNLEGQVAGITSSVGSETSTGLVNSTGEAVEFSSLTVGQLTVNLDMVVNGPLQVNGPAEFTGTTLFDSLVTFGDSVLFNGPVTFGGDVAFNNNTAGFAEIKPGESGITVVFAKPFAAPPVITVSLGDGKFATYSYRNVTANGFEIVLPAPASEKFKFSWVALSVNNVQTFVSGP